MNISKTNIRNHAGKILLLFLAGIFLSSPKGNAQVKDDFGFSDSLFKKMNIEELIKIKKFYDSKVQKLRTEEEVYRGEGLEWSKGFLAEKGEKIKDRDKIYIRMAEYYIEESNRQYEQAVDEQDRKYDEYERNVVRFEKKEISAEPAPPEIPLYDYSTAIAIYDRLLTEYPASEYADDALYNKAWLLEKMNRGEDSRRIFYEVIDKYPDGPFAPESYMRLADYYFAPREDKTEDEQIIVELNKAIQLYKNVLKYRHSKRYDEALYKLGWTYYKLAAKESKYYNDAITYFLAVVDDISEARQLDPRGTISNINVRDEAIEYIGISFTDEAYTKNGVEKAKKILKKIGDPEYGPEIVQAIGQTYQKIDEQEKAIYAFRTLLQMYPNFKRAPQVQQNIVNALFSLGRDGEAYLAREELHQKYNPKSEWHQNLEKSDDIDKIKYMDEAYKLSEAGLRTNLLLDLEKAEEAQAKAEGSTPLYERFAAQCKGYLNSYPADSNAYDINWSYAFMLDSRLSRFEDAYEEYIRVSNDYLENSHQHDAALNAVAVADTIVEKRYGTKSDTSKFNLALASQLSPEELTPEETRLIESYDNYIRLFPNGQYTPNFLAAAGGIHYNHKKFAEAKVYFQTLVKRFPNAEQKSLAMRSVMDSYFALGKFKDSEIIAKRIMSEANVPEEQRKFAEVRLGQAIFKNAEYLQEQGDFFNAASEFVRVYAEAPSDRRLVEAALFNGGLNYQKVKDWVRAIETFDILTTNFPDSKFALDALENIAKDYQELEQYANAAQTYERVFNSYRKSPNAELGLYNASIFYRKAQDWNNAIRVNNLYISTYPTASFAVDFYFNNADLYLKLDNITEANKIYEEFARKYPDDPRTVTAFYERGRYYLKMGMIDQAKAELNQAIARSESFRAKGKDPNAFIAGEAVNTLAEILHNEFIAIELKQPRSNIETNQKRMQNLMKELNQAYSRVVGFGSQRSFEATYNIARTYEEFADIFTRQEIDPNLSEEKKFVDRNKINEQSAALYEKAVEQYKEVIHNIPLIAEKLGVPLNAQVESTVMATDTSDTSAIITRATEMDSTRQLAIKWHEGAKDKISSLLYTQATITSENVVQAFDMKSPYKDVVQDIVFQLALFKKVATPAVQKTIAAHIHNIQEAQTLGLQNKYVEESKRQIILTSDIMGAELEKLAYSALAEYENIVRENKGLIEMEFGAKNQKKQDYYVLDNIANQLIDYIKIISANIQDAYANTLNIARQNSIENDLVRNTENRLLRYSVEVTDKMSLLADSAKISNTYYKTRFDSTQNYNYDDATGFFENYYFNYTDQSKAILERAFEIQQEYAIQNLWANRLLVKLIKLDPATYSANIQKDKIIMTSDETWKCTTVYYPEQWTRLEFDDGDWPNAVIIQDGANQFAPYSLNLEAIWVRNQTSQTTQETQASDSLITLTSDSTATIDSTATQTSMVSIGKVTADTLVFLRKSFELKGTPVTGRFYTSADNDFRIYLNGEFLIDDEANDWLTVDSLDFYTFDTYLKQGKNVISIDVEDKDLTGKGMKFYGSIEVLPMDITAAAEEKAKVSRVLVDPSLLRKINTLNKNRISISTH